MVFERLIVQDKIDIFMIKHDNKHHELILTLMIDLGRHMKPKMVGR